MELSEKIRQEKEKIEKIERILKLFPDLSENIDRWQRVRLHTEKANTIVDEVEIAHSCGCCDDAPLYVWTYKKFEGIPVYSKPAYFFVGEKVSYGSGDRPNEGWQDQLKAAGLSGTIIAKVQEYFNNNHPQQYELVDDED